VELEITENGVSGKIDFQIDEESISVFQIYASPQRQGVGTKLVKELESLALEKKLKSIIVPATPSKEALRFWIKMGYGFISIEDIDIADSILNSSVLNAGEIFDTDSGILLLSKNIGG
jgi:GNAT superfamily N-acetyltransferase